MQKKMDLKSWELPELEKTRRQKSTQSIGKHKTGNIRQMGVGGTRKTKETWEEAPRQRDTSNKQTKKTKKRNLLVPI